METSYFKITGYKITSKCIRYWSIKEPKMAESMTSHDCRILDVCAYCEILKKKIPKNGIFDDSVVFYLIVW